MKHNLRAVFSGFAALALSVGLLINPSAASPAISLSVSPNTGLETGDSMTITVANLVDGYGVYASLCKAGATPMDVPVYCDPNTLVWMTANGGSGSVTSPTSVTVSSSFTGQAGQNTSDTLAVDCLVDDCVVYVRADHMHASDYSYIRTAAVTFVDGGVIKSNDSATATYGSVTLHAHQAGHLSYRKPITLNVETASGLPTTLTSLTPDCSVVGNVVTALTGTGVCAIGVTTAGDDEYNALSTNFPFYLHITDPVLTANWWSLKKVVVGQSVNFPKSKFSTDLGQDVQLKSTNRAICQVQTKATYFKVLFLKAGTCQLQATAWGIAGKANTVKVFRSYGVTRY